MKNVIFNIQAIKKSIKKSQLNYYNCADDNVIIWNSNGFYAIKTKKMIFAEEIQTALPTFEQTELPQCIKNIVLSETWETVPEIRRTNILYQFPDDKITNIFYNAENDYITAVNTELLNIIKYIENYTIKQPDPKSAILVTDDITNIVIMPMYNKYLKDNIIKEINK